MPDNPSLAAPWECQEFAKVPRGCKEDLGMVVEIIKLRGQKSIHFSLALTPFQINGTWVPNNEERRASWELYIQLATRISELPSGPADGLLGEALSSLSELVVAARDILQRFGPDVAARRPGNQYNFGMLTIALMNIGLRPMIGRWDVAFQDWEAVRPEGRSPAEHQRAWDSADELQSALGLARDLLTQYAQLMGAACGVSDLLEVVALPKISPAA